MKQDEKQEDVLRLCNENDIVELSILKFFGDLWEDFDGDDNVAGGLTRLHSIDTPPPAFVNLSSQSKKYLLSIARLCPDLLRQQDGSSIASEASSVGSLYTVVPDHDTTEELGAMRVAMTFAFGVAKTRGMGKDDFDAEARKLFNDTGGDYQKTFKFVVPANFQPQPSNDGATAESHFDAISKAAANAFANWCKPKPVGTFDRLVTKVFKKM